MPHRRIVSRVLCLMVAATTAAGCAVAHPEVGPISARRVRGAAAAPDPVGSAEPAAVTIPSASPERAVRVPSGLSKPAVRRFPERGNLRIASAGITGPVVATYLDETLDMVIPPNHRDVAWLDYGSYPGPLRNVVLAGHRRWAGKQGTLWRLDAVAEGDEVTVDVDGRTHTYRVLWNRLYDPANAPVDELMGETATHSLTLITCGGRFDPANGHWTHRIVVRAEAVAVAAPRPPPARERGAAERARPTPTPAPTPRATPRPSPGLLPGL